MEREWKLLDLLYANDIRRPKVMVNEVCRRGGLKVNADKSKVVMIRVEEGLEWEIHVDGNTVGASIRVHIFWVFVDESGIDVTECCWKVTSERKAAGAISSLVNSEVCNLSVVKC